MTIAKVALRDRPMRLTNSMCWRNTRRRWVSEKWDHREVFFREVVVRWQEM